MIGNTIGVATSINMIINIYPIDEPSPVNSPILPASHSVTLNLLPSALIQKTMSTEIKKLAELEYDDLLSTDFAKARIGNTRIDPYGGFQQYFVYANRITNFLNDVYLKGRGKEYGKFQKNTGLDTTENFLENKFNPLMSFVAVILNGRDFQGNPTNVKTEIAERFVPIIIQDMYELAQENPNLIPLSLFAMLGMNVNTYNSNKSKENESPFVQ